MLRNVHNKAYYLKHCPCVCVNPRAVSQWPRQGSTLEVSNYAEMIMVPKIKMPLAGYKELASPFRDI